MRKYRFAGYRVVEFSPGSRRALREIARQLLPERERIIDTWIRRQWAAWQPPGITRAELRQVYGGLFRKILDRMLAREPEMSLVDLEDAGRELAAKRFPFEALVISVHFLEESYMPFLLNADPVKPSAWFVAMDEFLHAALASIATSYFEAYRKDLLDEVQVGRIVQEGLLADMPRRAADLQISHVYISAREKAQLGGDFLDYFALDDGRLVFTIGDLSGHGLEAAADSVTLRSIFRGFMREEPDITNAMARLSRVAASELRLDQFATMLAAEYQPTGRLTLVSAGHPSPVLCEDGHCGLIDLVGIALGVDVSPEYRAFEVSLPPGGVFVAYTDGLIEARADHDQFGEHRLVATVDALSRSTARAIADDVVDESLRHSGGSFVDDVAVLVLKRDG